MKPMEVKQVVVGIITSAVSARKLDEAERVKQYSEDLRVLTEDMKFDDYLQVAPLLGDICAMLIDEYARSHDTTAEAAMKVVGPQILGAELTSEDDLP